MTLGTVMDVREDDALHAAITSAEQLKAAPMLRRRLALSVKRHIIRVRIVLKQGQRGRNDSHDANQRLK
jgi:hypothetical protein